MAASFIHLLEVAAVEEKDSEDRICFITINATIMTTALQPLQQGQRDKNLDILRVFAMAGVLFVFCAGDMGIAEAYNKSALDEGIVWFKWIMVEERMYNMLILVFGVGF